MCKLCIGNEVELNHTDVELDKYTNTLKLSSWGKC